MTHTMVGKGPSMHHSGTVICTTAEIWWIFCDPSLRDGHGSVACAHLWKHSIGKTCKNRPFILRLTPSTDKHLNLSSSHCWTTARYRFVCSTKPPRPHPSHPRLLILRSTLQSWVLCHTFSLVPNYFRLHKHHLLIVFSSVYQELFKL